MRGCKKSNTRRNQQAESSKIGVKKVIPGDKEKCKKSNTLNNNNRGIIEGDGGLIIVSLIIGGLGIASPTGPAPTKENIQQ